MDAAPGLEPINPVRMPITLRDASPRSYRTRRHPDSFTNISSFLEAKNLNCPSCSRDGVIRNWTNVLKKIFNMQQLGRGQSNFSYARALEKLLLFLYHHATKIVRNTPISIRTFLNAQSKNVKCNRNAKFKRSKFCGVNVKISWPNTSTELLY